MHIRDTAYTSYPIDAPEQPDCALASGRVHRLYAATVALQSCCRPPKRSARCTRSPEASQSYQPTRAIARRTVSPRAVATIVSTAMRGRTAAAREVIALGDHPDECQLVRPRRSFDAERDVGHPCPHGRRRRHASELFAVVADDFR